MLAPYQNIVWLLKDKFALGHFYSDKQSIIQNFTRLLEHLMVVNKRVLLTTHLNSEDFEILVPLILISIGLIEQGSIRNATVPGSPVDCISFLMRCWNAEVASFKAYAKVLKSLSKIVISVKIDSKTRLIFSDHERVDCPKLLLQVKMKLLKLQCRFPKFSLGYLE